MAEKDRVDFEAVRLAKQAIKPTPPGPTPTAPPPASQPDEPGYESVGYGSRMKRPVRYKQGGSVLSYAKGGKIIPGQASFKNGFKR